MRIVFLLLIFCMSISAFGDIRHLELGAANYGSRPENSEKQYLVLEQTLRDLIVEFGSSGIIYLNDIDDVGLLKAKNWAVHWLHENGYSKIKIEILAGDYAKIEIPSVKTANLTNPDLSQLPFSRSDSRIKTLEKIASKSENGLVITTGYFSDKQEFFKNVSGLVQDSFLISTNTKGYNYYAPDGSDLGTYEPWVFILIPKVKTCRVLFSN